MGLSLIPSFSIGGSGVPDANFVWTQTIPSATWTIAHNLNKYPSVVIIDDLNNLIIADVQFTDTNNVIITFALDSTGKAIFN